MTSTLCVLVVHRTGRMPCYCTRAGVMTVRTEICATSAVGAHSYHLPEATFSLQRYRETSRPPFCGSRNPNERNGDDRVKWEEGGKGRRRGARFFFFLPPEKENSSLLQLHVSYIPHNVSTTTTAPPRNSPLYHPSILHPPLLSCLYIAILSPPLVRVSSSLNCIPLDGVHSRPLSRGPAGA
jgi:hypothetical protein